ncbi:hypothetical protein AgCh_040207 [Apium graveolens]
MDRDSWYSAAIAGDTVARARLDMRADEMKKNKETILHVESKIGNTEHVRFILREFANKNLLGKLNIKNETALHLAIYRGHTKVARVIIEAARRHLSETSFQDFLRQGDEYNDTALHAAVMGENKAIVKLLVEADPTDRHTQNDKGKTPMFIAAEMGFKDIIEIISTICTARCLEGPDGSTALHAAVKNRNHNFEVVEVLIDAARRLLSSDSGSHDTESNPVTSFQAFLRRVDEDLNTALHIAVMQGNMATAKLLTESDPSYLGIKNNKGETPFYIAAERGYPDILKMICTTSTAAPVNLYGHPSSWHAVIKNLDEEENEVIDVIKLFVDICKSALISEIGDLDEYTLYRVFAAEIFSQIEDGQTILELAVKRNYVKVVELLLDVRNPDYKHEWIGDDFISLMPLIYIAKDKDYKNMVKVLNQRYQAGTKLSTHLKNQASLISAIRKRKTETVFSLLDDHADSLVTYVDNLGWTALHHAVYHEFSSIIKPIVEAQKDLEADQKDFELVYRHKVSTPFHVAAKRGSTSTVILLMQLWSPSSSAYTSVEENGHNILHLAALQSKKHMIQGILKYCPDEHKNELVNKQDNDGNTPLHLLIKLGCFVPELLHYEGLDISLRNRKEWKPSDMLYVGKQIKNDQKWDHFSPVSASERKRKDENFKKQAEIMIDEKLTRMKEDTRAIAQCYADAIAGDPICRDALEMEADTLNAARETILHVESKKGVVENVRFIVTALANKNLLVKLDNKKQTALYIAAHHGHTKVVEALLEAARRNFTSSSTNDDPVTPFQGFIRQANIPDQNTALHVAVLSNDVATVKLLLQADPNDSHVKNNKGKTPIYIALENGFKDVVKQICTSCTTLSLLDGPADSTTALHALIQNLKQGKEEDRDLIMMTINAAKRWSFAEDARRASFKALFHRTDESGRSPLELAMYHNHVNAVELILREDIQIYQKWDNSSPVSARERKRKDENFKKQAEIMIDEKLTRMKEDTRAIAQCYADAIAGDPICRDALEMEADTLNAAGETILHVESKKGVVENVQYIVSALANKNLLVKLDNQKQTALYIAAHHGHTQVVEALLDAAGRNFTSFSTNDDPVTPFQAYIRHANVPDQNTALHVAALSGDMAIVKLLVKSDPNDSHVKNNEGKTPIYIAAENGFKDVVKEICTTCTNLSLDGPADSTTALHALFQNLKQGM